jgi:hypothetical protein
MTNAQRIQKCRLKKSIKSYKTTMGPYGPPLLRAPLVPTPYSQIFYALMHSMQERAHEALVE